MKTNQLMAVNFGGHILHIEHLTKIGSLTDLWGIGNGYRVAKGLNPLRLDSYLTSPETQEFVDAIERDLGISKSHGSSDLQLFDLPGKSKSLDSRDSKLGRVPTIKSPLIITKRGKNGGTWAHLYILIDIALNYYSIALV